MRTCEVDSGGYRVVRTKTRSPQHEGVCPHATYALTWISNPPMRVCALTQWWVGIGVGNCGARLPKPPGFRVIAQKLEPGEVERAAS